jgi:hypothetical protein
MAAAAATSSLETMAATVPCAAATAECLASLEAGIRQVAAAAELDRRVDPLRLPLSAAAAMAGSQTMRPFELFKIWTRPEPHLA